MHKPKPIIFIFLLYLIDFIHAQRQTNVTCPNYSYKCPKCKEDQFCSYPLSHGCEGSGVPVCQSKNCHGVVCAPKALPCPDECPFTCEYHGPPCCPFIGQPTCSPPCETFAPCAITPCPEDCPEDCFYPNADYCCPKSGKPICRSQLGDIGSIQQSKHLKRAKILDGNSTPGSTDNGFGESGSPALGPVDNDTRNPICIDMIVPCPPQCPNNCEYPIDMPCPKTHPPKCRSTVNVDQHDEKDNSLTTKLSKLVNEFSNIVAQLEDLLVHQYKFLEWKNQQHKSPVSAHHTPLSQISPTTTTSTTTTPGRLPSSKICSMIYVPCPELCPTTCLRPADAPCPLSVPGYCP